MLAVFCATGERKGDAKTRWTHCHGNEKAVITPQFSNVFFSVMLVVKASISLVNCLFGSYSRPYSAMTTRERDQEIDLALHQMSSKVKDFIKEALAHEYEEFSNPRNSPEPKDKNSTANSDVSKRNNCATALKVRPPSGKRPDSGTRRNSRSNSAVAIKLPQTTLGSRPTSGQSSNSSRLSSARSLGNPAEHVGFNGKSPPSRPNSGKSTDSMDSSKSKRIDAMKTVRASLWTITMEASYRFDLASHWSVSNEGGRNMWKTCG